MAWDFEVMELFEVLYIAAPPCFVRKSTKLIGLPSFIIGGDMTLICLWDLSVVNTCLIKSLQEKVNVARFSVFSLNSHDLNRKYIELFINSRILWSKIIF